MIKSRVSVFQKAEHIIEETDCGRGDTPSNQAFTREWFRAPVISLQEKAQCAFKACQWLLICCMCQYFNHDKRRISIFLCLESILLGLLPVAALSAGLCKGEGCDAWQPEEIYRSRRIVPASCAAITPPNPPNADITSYLSDGIQTFGLASKRLTLTKHCKLQWHTDQTIENTDIFIHQEIPDHTKHWSDLPNTLGHAFVYSIKQLKHLIEAIYNAGKL